MAVPKKKMSKRRSGMRTAVNNKVTMPILTKCPKCGEVIKPHTACKFCGYYGDKKVLDVETKLDKKAKKEEKRSENSDQN